MHRLLSGLMAWALACLIGCAAGAPPGFSSGTSWTVPVVGALDDGPLIAPVYINDKGPFLFMLNPRAWSTIDPELARNLDIWVDRTDERILSSSDKFSHEKTDYAEILALRIGTLSVDKTKFVTLSAGARYHGQRVWGTIGREVFAESLVWTIDRDRQQVHIAVQGHQRAPTTATRIEAKRIKGNKFFVTAMLNGNTSAYVYIDPCVYGSRIWPGVASAAQLPQRGPRWVAPTVKVGRIDAMDVPFFEYQDKRVRKRDWDGMLGMEFFARYHVTINWHEKSVWLDERLDDLNDVVRDRLQRWGANLDSCTTAGCVTGAMSTADDTTTLAFEREPAISGVGLEAIFEAVDETGRPLRLPRVIVAFPAVSTSAAIRGEALKMYAHAAGLRLVDVTPFVPPCEAPGGQGCVFVDNR